MNQLESRIRGIMEQAMLGIIHAIQAAPAIEIGGAFSSLQRAAHVAPSTSGAPARRRQATRGVRTRSRSEDLAATLEFIAGAPGPVALSEIANAIGLPAESAAPKIKALRDANLVVMHGDRRSARYTADPKASLPAGMANGKASPAPEPAPPVAAAPAPPVAPPGTVITDPQMVLGPANGAPKAKRRLATKRVRRASA